MEPLERAITELNQRNYGSAVRSLEMLTARDPSNADAYRHLARAYHEVGERQKAADAAQRYAALRPADASGHYNAGVLLAQLGHIEAAERSVRAALAADPSHAKARRALHNLTEQAEAASAAEPQAATPASEEPGERRGIPWQGKVAAALTVIASLAIVLWLFLPGGPARRGLQRLAPEPSPHQVTTPPPEQPSADQPMIARAPQPTPTPETQPQPQTSPPTPATERPPIQPMPETREPSRATPAARTVWRRVWRAPPAQYPRQPIWGTPGLYGPMQPSARTPGTTGALQAVPQASGGGMAGTGQQPGTGDSNAGKGEGTQPGSTTPTASRTQAPQPAPAPQQPQPAPPQAEQPQPLFTPDEAQKIAKAMDDAEREEIQGTLSYLANWLRTDPACNDPDFWPILQTALATTGASMAPQGLTIGAGEVMALITNADTAWRAADNLEMHSRNLRSVLPYAVQGQIAQALASSTSANHAYSLVDTVLRQRNTSVSNRATQVLVEAALRAEREKAKIEGRR